MKLLDQIRRDHARGKNKRPRRLTSHAAVGAIAVRYGLTENFVETTGVPRVPAGNGFITGPFREKKKLDAVPFFLADPERHAIAKRITQAADNPYLAFARSPEEIPLSKLLFAMNPDIGPDLLERRHFETLIQSELAKSRLRELRAAFEELSAWATTQKERARASGKKRSRQPEPVRSSLDVTRRRIRALGEFIDRVENPKGSEGGG